MSFTSPEKIDRVLARLRTKRTRQAEALEDTEQEIEHWRDQLEMFEKRAEKLTPKK